jgi:hypothetical protein
LGGQQLDYVLNGVYTWYLSVLLVLGVHWSGLWSLTAVYDNFGRIMTCAIITQVRARVPFCALLIVVHFVCLEARLADLNLTLDSGRGVGPGVHPGPRN